MTTSATITLGSDWSVAGITDRWAQVSILLADLKTKTDRAGNKLLISLHNMECLDACGCQLLALFVRDLKKLDIEPCLVQVPEGLRNTIDTLGFAQYFHIADLQAGE